MSERPSEVLVRAFEPSDLPDLNEAWNQPRAVWGTLQLPYVSLEAHQKRAANSPPGMIHLVAVIEGKAIGSAVLNRFENRRSHAGSIGMAVHDAYAGRGAGTALMRAIVELADDWLNLKRLELNVYADNGPAIALYERCGFEREGLYRAYAWRAGAYVDAIAMARLRL